MKYTALTIGPIYRSINEGRKLREIWGASFLFSTLMKKIIQHLKDNSKNNFNIIIPYPNKDEIIQKAKIKDVEKIKSAGVFPDRLIIKSQNGMYQALENAINHAKEYLKDELKSVNCENASEYVDKYFQFNIVETQLDENQNPVFEMNRYLAMTELQEKLLPRDPLCFLKFLLNISNTQTYQAAFGKDRSFPSIIEISAGKMTGEEGREELKQIFKKSLERDDDDIIKNIIGNDELKKHFKQPHKYIAIVQSDGDNVGKLIIRIYEENPRLIQTFSKQLSTFAIRAADKINEYGGHTVYAGGDDLLFFAPVLTINSNVFKLIDELDKIFKEELWENEELKPIIKKMENKPNMSYGVSISYYKFPMNEALNQARHQLFNEAKRGKKNNIAYTWLKHSGQSFHDVIHKDENNSFYSNFKKLIKAPAEIKLLSSLIYNLNNHKPILANIINNFGKHDKLDNYFDNFYDESIHKKHKDIIQLVKNLLIEACVQTQKEDKNKDVNVDKVVNKVYTALRFVKFLNQKASHE